MDAPVAVDADQHSVTVAWKEVPGAIAYELQVAVPSVTGTGAQPEGATEQGEEWTSLSSSLKQTIVKKKNLESGSTYRFRVRARDKIDWQPFSTPGEAQTLGEHTKQCVAPRLTSRGGDWLAVSWEATPGAEKYHIQMRAEGELQWKDLATVSGTAAKKKSLKGTYYFRVKPELGEGQGEEEWSYSPSSEACTTATLPPNLRALLGSTLLCKADGSSVSVEDLAGKVVGVYASAHWCGPCRQFTPLLSQFYTRVKAQGRPFELVFASGDHDEKGMLSYYADMPFLALPYDAEQREAFMANYQVRSIPRLVIFGADGRVLQENAVGQEYLTDQALAYWERGQAVPPHQHGVGLWLLYLDAKNGHVLNRVQWKARDEDEEETTTI